MSVDSNLHGDPLREKPHHCGILIEHNLILLKHIKLELSEAKSWISPVDQGEKALYFEEQGNQVMGIDIAPTGIESKQEKANYRNL